VYRVSELVTTRVGLDKLGKRGISARDLEQIPRNAPVTVTNPPQRQGPRKRLLLIGRTDGGRVLTLVVERTIDPTTWLVVTGWQAAERERTILERYR
jgi:uncharacterized DUF497 family protein